MIKRWLLLLSILLFASTISSWKTIETITEYSMTQSRPFYKNVDQNFSSSDANLSNFHIWVNKSFTTKTSIIFYWNDYADSWNDFKANYGNLNLKINMKIYFWSNLRWESNGISVSLNDISSNSDWKKLIKTNNETLQPHRWDNTWAELYYAIWVNGGSVSIRFRLVTEATNDYDCYTYSITTKRVASNTSFDAIEEVKARFGRGVNNKSLNLESDYSASLQDERNIPKEKKAIDELVEAALDKYYKTWKSFIKDYAYSDKTNQATVTVKFNHPNTNKAIRWDFKVSINFILSKNYWKKEFENRLTIIPGKIIDPNNPNGAMIEDKPLKWQDKDVYSTTAFVSFSAKSDGSETMKVNDVKIDVIDNIFTFKMTDNQDYKTNEYDILLERHDLNDFNKVIGKYQVKYVIKQDIANLKLKWYAWNPKKNPDQNKLITPSLPNGKPNPNYDKEVNPSTGTKTQIVWIKHKAQNPFPLDPLDKNGDKITNNIYDEGFLAEGSVSGMGIAQMFDDLWIKSVQRVKVDPKTLKPIGDLKIVEANNDGGYWSESGTYLYILTDQKGLTSNKFIVIGQKWKDKYVKFLDILDNSNTAVPFWSTLQGFHLKNYLAKYKQLSSKDIQNLVFEQVSSYWKEYVSDVKSQRISPGDNPGDNFDLGSIKFETIKMNKITIEEIRDEIKKQVKEQLARTKLIYGVDYELKPFDEESLKKLLNYDRNGNSTITLNISALDTATKVIGTNKIKIINSIHYDPNTVIDLKNIHFKTQIYNFSKFTVDKLKAWIFKDIDRTFEAYKIDLNYPKDYSVKPLDNEVLEQFLTSKIRVSLILTIYSQDNSLKTKNSTTLELVNDPNAPIVPPDPDPKPIPKPDPPPISKPDPPPISKPDPKPIEPSKKIWITKSQNLIIMTVIAVLVVGISGTTFFLKYRFKKGIGGKKSKNESLNQTDIEIEK